MGAFLFVAVLNEQIVYRFLNRRIVATPKFLRIGEIRPML